MKRTWMVAAMAALTMVAGTAAAADLPPGKWWRRPEIAATLALTSDQQTRLDATFRSAANELIDLKGETEKLMIAIRGELDQPQLSRENLQRLANRLNDARGRLFQRELMMLVDMRSVLNDDQWSKLRAELDRQRPQRMDGSMRPPRMDGRPLRPPGRRRQ